MRREGEAAAVGWELRGLLGGNSEEDRRGKLGLKF